MSELLLELFSEEIPAKMQKKASLDMVRIFEQKFKEMGGKYQNILSEYGPRRISLHVSGIDKIIEGKTITKKGPKCSANKEAIAGFIKNNKITINDLIIKDDCYFYDEVHLAQDASHIIKTIIEEMIASFPWPKSMRWGNYKIRWIRPLRNILAIFDNEILPVKFGHLTANNLTYAHHFLNHNSQVTVTSFLDYKKSLAQNNVISSAEDRKVIIISKITEILDPKGLKLIEDKELLEEVAGIVELPHVLLGEIPKEYMLLPKEVLITAMRNHQRYFSVANELGYAPYFIIVANINKNDAEVIKGNQKVLNARLADAKFFYDTDLQNDLEFYTEKLKDLVFHAKYGTIFDKIIRVKKLASYINKLTYNIDDNLVERAISLIKADLATKMVAEFPELQGIIGSYYAKAQNENEAVVKAIREHYLPLATSDEAPTSPLSVIAALSDKLDSLVGLFVAGEKVTGSRDPFAMRRLALNIIKIIISNKLSLDIKQLIVSLAPSNKSAQEEILNFILERFRHFLKEEYDDLYINAFRGNHNLYEVMVKVAELSKFHKSEIGRNAIASAIRAVNITKSNKEDLPVNAALATSSLEQNLIKAINEFGRDVSLKTLPLLTCPINDFFDNLLVNDPDINIRNNRLAIIISFTKLFNKIADFSEFK